MGGIEQRSGPKTCGSTESKVHTSSAVSFTSIPINHIEREGRERERERERGKGEGGGRVSDCINNCLHDVNTAVITRAN